MGTPQFSINSWLKYFLTEFQHRRYDPDCNIKGLSPPESQSLWLVPFGRLSDPPCPPVTLSLPAVAWRRLVVFLMLMTSLKFTSPDPIQQTTSCLILRFTHTSEHQQDSYLQNVLPVNPLSVLQSIKQLNRHPGNTRFAMELCMQNRIANCLSLNRQ